MLLLERVNFDINAFVKIANDNIKAFTVNDSVDKLSKQSNLYKLAYYRVIRDKSELYFYANDIITVSLSNWCRNNNYSYSIEKAKVSNQYTPYFELKTTVYDEALIVKLLQLCSAQLNKLLGISLSALLKISTTKLFDKDYELTGVLFYVTMNEYAVQKFTDNLIKAHKDVIIPSVLNKFNSLLLTIQSMLNSQYHSEILQEFNYQKPAKSNSKQLSYQLSYVESTAIIKLISKSANTAQNFKIIIFFNDDIINHSYICNIAVMPSNQSTGDTCKSFAEIVKILMTN